MITSSRLGRVRRFWPVLVVLALLAALATGWSMLRDPADEPGTRDSLRAVSEPAPTRTPEPTTTPTAEPTNSAVPNVALDPTGTEGPRPTASAARGSSGGYGGDAALGPAAPGSVSVPHSKGQHVWKATSNGYTMTLSASPATVHAGDTVTFTLTMSTSLPRCCEGYVVYGNGLTSGGYGAECGTTYVGKSPTTRTFTTTYNQAGTATLLFGAGQGGCGSDDGQGSARGKLDVLPGTSTSNGPAKVLVDLAFDGNRGGTTGTQGGKVWVVGHANDEDGYVYKMRVQWGDGTTTVVGGDQRACQTNPSSGWPVNSDAQVGGPDTTDGGHRYTYGGDYTVTLTAYSRGCDGRDGQQASTTMQVRAPGAASPAPEPSSTPSPAPTA